MNTTDSFEKLLQEIESQNYIPLIVDSISETFKNTILAEQQSLGEIENYKKLTYENEQLMRDKIQTFPAVVTPEEFLTQKSSVQEQHDFQIEYLSIIKNTEDTINSSQKVIDVLTNASKSSQEKHEILGESYIVFDKQYSAQEIADALSDNLKIYAAQLANESDASYSYDTATTICEQLRNANIICTIASKLYREAVTNARREIKDNVVKRCQTIVKNQTNAKPAYKQINKLALFIPCIMLLMMCIPYTVAGHDSPLDAEIILITSYCLWAALVIYPFTYFLIILIKNKRIRREFENNQTPDKTPQILEYFDDKFKLFDAFAEIYIKVFSVVINKCAATDKAWTELIKQNYDILNRIKDIYEKYYSSLPSELAKKTIGKIIKMMKKGENFESALESLNNL